MRNRGPQPNDPALFASKHLPALTAATDDLCWLLSRDYGIDSALLLVGNRYRLNKRQRMASDSWILDDGGAWCNLGRELLVGEDIWAVSW